MPEKPTSDTWIFLGVGQIVRSVTGNSVAAMASLHMRTALEAVLQLAADDW